LSSFFLSSLPMAAVTAKNATSSTVVFCVRVCVRARGRAADRERLWRAGGGARCLGRALERRRRRAAALISLWRPRPPWRRAPGRRARGRPLREGRTRRPGAALGAGRAAITDGARMPRGNRLCPPLSLLEGRGACLKKNAGRARGGPPPVRRARHGAGSGARSLTQCGAGAAAASHGGRAALSVGLTREGVMGCRRETRWGVVGGRERKRATGASVACV
jgi:hypothetical protein